MVLSSHFYFTLFFKISLPFVSFSETQQLLPLLYMLPLCFFTLSTYLYYKFLCYITLNAYIPIFFPCVQFGCPLRKYGDVERDFFSLFGSLIQIRLRRNLLQGGNEKFSLQGPTEGASLGFSHSNHPRPKTKKKPSRSVRLEQKGIISNQTGNKE